MRVLVTGGTGVVGTSTVTALVAAGHTVRLLSRHAARDSRQWPTGVESWPAQSKDAVARNLVARIAAALGEKTR